MILSRSPSQSLSISQSRAGNTLSAAQKTFNRLLKQIEKKRDELAAWDAMSAEFQKCYTTHWLPLDQRRNLLQGQIVQRLDAFYDQKGFSKKEKRALSEVILRLAASIEGLQNDPELTAIYNRHSESDLASDLAEDEQQARDMLGEMLGIEIDFDFDINDPAAFMQQMQKKMFVEAEEAPPPRKKTAKQQAREAAAEAEEKNVSEVLREVYRKLASALHPDREPDPAERERKNQLMQKVNQAYDKRNLLQLLELQLELEHIDPTQLAKLGEDKLKRFNRILKEQSDELGMELIAVQSRFMMQFKCEVSPRSKPHQVLMALDVEVIGLEKNLHDMQRDFEGLTDTAAIKVFVRDVHQALDQRAALHFDDIPF